MGNTTQAECLSHTRSKEPGILCDYMDYLYIEKKLSEHTSYNYYMSLRTLAKFLYHMRHNMVCEPDEVVLTGVSLDEMTTITSEEWWSFLDYYEFKQRETKGSLAVRISIVTGFYKWVELTHSIPSPTFIRSTTRPEHKRKDYINVTPSMEAKIIEHLGERFQDRDACIVRLFLHCGIGLKEICELQMEDISMREITVPGRQKRTIPLDEKTIKYIDNYLAVRVPPIDGGNPFFVSAKRGRLRPCSIEKCIRKSVTRAGPSLAGVTIRDMQLTAKTRLAKELSAEAAFAQCNVNSKSYFQSVFCRPQRSA